METERITRKGNRAGLLGVFDRIRFNEVLRQGLGLLLVAVGGLRGWAWVRNPWFRLTHLAAIVAVSLRGAPPPAAAAPACEVSVAPALSKRALANRRASQIYSRRSGRRLNCRPGSTMLAGFLL